MRGTFFIFAAVSTGCWGSEPRVTGLAASLPGPLLIARPSARTSALRAGSSDPSVPGPSASVVVDGEPRVAMMAPDESFVVPELSAGTSALGFEIGPARGYLTLDDLAYGEVVEVAIGENGRHLQIDVSARSAPDRPTYAISIYRSGGLVIVESGGDYFLAPGVFLGNLEIYGNDVRVFGRNLGEPCSERMGSTFLEDMIIRGDRVEVYGVSAERRLIISGNQDKVSDPCRGLWATTRVN